jgi:hypothetical protein
MFALRLLPDRGKEKEEAVCQLVATCSIGSIPAHEQGMPTVANAREERKDYVAEWRPCSYYAIKISSFKNAARDQDEFHVIVIIPRMYDALNF